MRTRQGIVSVLLGYCGGAMLGISHSVPLTQAGLRLSAGWNRNSRDLFVPPMPHPCSGDRAAPGRGRIKVHT